MRSLFRLCGAMALSALLLPAADPAPRRAPGFALPDIRLQYRDLADYRGKVVLVEFMQTTCPNCQALSAVLERVKAKYGDRVAVLSITNPPDNQQSVARYAQQYKLTTPILFDCGQVAASYLRVTPENPTIHLPHLFVIDAQGAIRHDLSHEAAKDSFTLEGLSARVDGLLKK